MLRQVDNAIDIFEGLTKGWAQGLFLFDNAPSHRRRAPDAISARYMVKGASRFPPPPPPPPRDRCSASTCSSCPRIPKANEGRARTSSSCAVAVPGMHCAGTSRASLPDTQAALQVAHLAVALTSLRTMVPRTMCRVCSHAAADFPGASSN